MKRSKKTAAQWRKEALLLRHELRKLSEANRIHIAEFDRVIMLPSGNNTKKLLKIIKLKGDLLLATHDARFNGLGIPWPYQDQD